MISSVFGIFISLLVYKRLLIGGVSNIQDQRLVLHWLLCTVLKLQVIAVIINIY